MHIDSVVIRFSTLSRRVLHRANGERGEEIVGARKEREFRVIKQKQDSRGAALEGDE